MIRSLITWSDPATIVTAELKKHEGVEDPRGNSLKERVTNEINEKVRQFAFETVRGR
jgi:hypothetical protein